MCPVANPWNLFHSCLLYTCMIRSAVSARQHLRHPCSESSRAREYVHQREMIAFSSSTDGTLPATSISPSMASAGVIMTPIEEISARSSTFSSSQFSPSSPIALSTASYSFLHSTSDPSSLQNSHAIGLLHELPTQAKSMRVVLPPYVPGTGTSLLSVSRFEQASALQEPQSEPPPLWPGLHLRRGRRASQQWL